MNLSIVITTYNRAEVLRRLLLSLTGQTDPDFQVVVAIDGSTDGTEAMLLQLQPQLPYPLKWVDTHCNEYGLAVARNLGILAADGHAVAILDDDSFPEPVYVAAHKQSAKAGVITGGPRNPADAGNEKMAWKMRELGKLPGLTPLTIPQLRRDWPNAYLIENNICMLRDDFISMGMFSERLKMYGYIGQEFFGRAEFLGLTYQYNHAAAVSHHGEIAGDNGFTTSRKVRQTRFAALLRPSLMKPHHYRAQVEWARSVANGKQSALPPFRLHAAASAPWRAVRILASGVRSTLRSMVRK